MENRNSDSNENGEEQKEALVSHPALNDEEVRVLGCLLEKEMTTPEYYPLTLKALTAACNQKSNREPVVAYDASTVAEAMEGLRYKHLSVSTHEHGSRGAKNKHILDRAHPYLSRRHFALLGVLLLRGRQTLGELRQRAERMHAFPDIDSTRAALDELINYELEPLVKRIPAGGGRRAETFMHLLSGDVDTLPARQAAAPREVEAPSWREEIESAIESLREDVAGLRSDLDELRKGLGGA